MNIKYSRRRTMTGIALLAVLSCSALSQPWKQVYPPYPVASYLCESRVGEDTLFLSGCNFAVLRSTNAGKGWERMHGAPGAYDIIRMGYDGHTLYMLPGGPRIVDEWKRTQEPRFLYAMHPATADTFRVAFPSMGLPVTSTATDRFDLSVARNALFILIQHFSTPVILRSMDKGLQWTTIPLPDSATRGYVHALNFRNDSCGFVFWRTSGSAERTCVLYSTDNGGRTWRAHPEISFDVNLDGVWISAKSYAAWIDDRHALAVANGCEIYTSSDGGSTWSKRATAPAAIRDIVLDTAARGYLVGANCEVLTTADGGSQWTQILPPTPTVNPYYGFGLPVGDSIFVLAATNGYLERTSDGGTTWSRISRNDRFQFSGMRCLSARDGIAASLSRDIPGGSERWKKTTDGGATWAIPLNLPDTRIVRIYPVSPILAYGYFGSDGGGSIDTLIIISTDAGITWLPSLIDSTALYRNRNPRAMFYPACHRGNDTAFLFAGGGNGMYRTYDRGQAWSFVQYDSAIAIADADMRFGDGCWARTSSSILRSVDDGSSWFVAASLPPGTYRFMKLFVHSALRAIAFAQGASNTTVCRTTDGGATWSTYQFDHTEVKDGDTWTLKEDGSGISFSTSQQTAWTPIIKVDVLSTIDGWRTRNVQFGFSVFYSTDFKTTSFGNDHWWLYADDRIFYSSSGGVDASADPPASSAPRLEQNYPNPAAGSTVIPYTVSTGGLQPIRIELFDALGRHIRLLHEGWDAFGEHRLSFDTSGLLPGLYFITLTTVENREIRSLIIAR